MGLGDAVKGPSDAVAESLKKVGADRYGNYRSGNYGGGSPKVGQRMRVNAGADGYVVATVVEVLPGGAVKIKLPGGGTRYVKAEQELARFQLE